MDGFVRGEWTFQAIHLEPVFYDLREKQKLDLLISLKTKSLAWKASKHNVDFLLSFQSPETVKHNTWNIISLREVLQFLARTMKKW